jgi:hypothetical protein
MRRLILLFAFYGFAISSIAQTGPGAMLPGKDDIAGWKPEGELEIFSRESIRNLSKEETDYILEYGLNYAIRQRYYNYRNKVITVEVYTMNNSFGSCGLFMRYGKKQRVFQEYGNSVYEKEGEYGFWKQLYFVKLKSAASGDTIKEGFRQISAFIDSKIRSKGIIPDILGFSKDKPGNVTIFRGPLALSEIYYFSPKNIFYINEGLAIENGNIKDIIFRYSDNNEAVRRFTEVAGLLSGMSKFSGFIMLGDFSFTMKDRDGKQLVFKVAEDCIRVNIK